MCFLFACRLCKQHASVLTTRLFSQLPFTDVLTVKIFLHGFFYTVFMFVQKGSTMLAQMFQPSGRVNLGADCWCHTQQHNTLTICIFSWVLATYWAILGVNMVLVTQKSREVIWKGENYSILQLQVKSCSQRLGRNKGTRERRVTGTGVQSRKEE
jgi:hypothetical protein